MSFLVRKTGKVAYICKLCPVWKQGSQIETEKKEIEQIQIQIL